VYKTGFSFGKSMQNLPYFKEEKKVTGRHIQTISFWRSPEQSGILKNICSLLADL
jgi:hypothetical protein